MSAADLVLARLGEASVETLLTTFASLTHQIGAYERKPDNKRGSATELRDQRDQVKDEIKRRTGDL